MFNINRMDLYYIPIEKLNLKVKTYNTFLRHGLVSVGDVLDMYVTLNHFDGAMIQIPSDIWNIPQKEVIVRIIEYLHDNHIDTEG